MTSVLNAGYEYRQRVAKDAAGRPLLDYLVQHYPHSTSAVWQERIETGAVTVDGERADACRPLRTGQTIVWQRPPWREPEVPRTYRTLFADDDMLVVDKPAGLPTVPAGGYLQNTLLWLVRQEHSRAVPLHRLGRWTSGIVVFALSGNARTILSRAWRTREVNKLYRTLATGRAPHRSFEISTAIGPVPHAVLGTIHAASRVGKRAESTVTVLETRPDAFLAAVKIISGRPHQIRIHLASAGHPLVGDPLYPHGGLPAPDSTVLPGEPGYSLHALSLDLHHPGHGGRIGFFSRPPDVLCMENETFDRPAVSNLS
jgi:23S rRNA pseudouridine1911/1915/1917 synthase